MFLSRNYILGNELVEKMGIHISNVSMLAKQYDEYNSSFIKRNNCVFINSKNKGLPKNISEGIQSNEFTDLSNKLPCTWVKSEYGITERELFKSKMVYDKMKISGKDFYVFDEEFALNMKNKIGYVLNKKEKDECLSKNQIEGSIELNKNKFFTWYSIYE